MSVFDISSNVSARKIVFSERRGDSFLVELLGHGLNASMVVSAYTDARGLLRWLERLAAYDAPWTGEDDWSTIEGEFQISARCSTVGQVFIQVHLRALPGSAEEWQTSAGIESDLGSMSRYASAARQFFMDQKG
jgi:hypothetical protein